MNEAAIGHAEGVTVEGTTGVHVLPIAVVDHTAKEISQLESDRTKLLMGMRAGARRVLELFLPAMQRSEDDMMMKCSSSSRMAGVMLGDNNDGYNNGHSSEQQLLLNHCSIEDLLDMMLPLAILDREVTHDDYKGTITVQGGMLI